MKFDTQSVSTNVPSCGFRIGQLSEFARLPNLVIETPSLLLYSKNYSVLSHEVGFDFVVTYSLRWNPNHRSRHLPHRIVCHSKILLVTVLDFSIPYSYRHCYCWTPCWEYSAVITRPKNLSARPQIRGGSVAHLTREVLELVTELQSQAVQIPLANSAQCYSSMKHYKDDISSFVGLKEWLSYCSVQDPGEETKSGYNERNVISIWTHTGRKLLTSDKYMDMIEAFRPDMYHVLCDSDTSVESSRKRALKAVDVTTKMFTECLERHLKSKTLRNSVLLAVLEGGYDLEARQKAAQLISQKQEVEGFVIEGLHNNGTSVETIAFETIEPVIEETLRHLPQDKLRVIHGGWRPDVVLQLVYTGIDLFDSSLVYMATLRGCALTFTYHILQPQEHNGLSNGIVNAFEHTKEDSEVSTNNPNEKKSEERRPDSCSKSSYEMDLSEKRYFGDLTPLLDKCECLTCTNHTRAYIHHLLNTREMLASVLLMIHNLHHYQKFFKAIREHGKKGRLLSIDSPQS